MPHEPARRKARAAALRVMTGASGATIAVTIYCSNTIVPVAAAAAAATAPVSDTPLSSFITVTTIDPVRTCRHREQPRRPRSHASSFLPFRGSRIREPSEGCKLVCCQCVALRTAFPRSTC